jgi:hypothetical protein
VLRSVIHLRDGSVKGFDKTEVQAALYLAKLDRALGREPRPTEFLDALAKATPESRGSVEALDEGAHYADLLDNDADEPDDLAE